MYVGVHHLDLARVNAGPDLDANGGNPIAELDRAVQGVARLIEHRKQAVPRGVRYPLRRVIPLGRVVASPNEECMKFQEAQAVATKHATSDYYVGSYRDMEKMYLPALLEEIESKSPTSVLEVGPGWGTTAVWLGDKGHDVTVMDLMPLGTWMTQEMIDTYGIKYVHNDIEDAMAPDGIDLGTFDLVIMTQVIPHLAWRPDRTLRHISGLMSADGQFITSVLDRLDYPDLDCAFGDDWTTTPEWQPEGRCQDIVKCMYTKETFSALLESVFDGVEIWKPKRSTVLFARASKRTG
jgi:SAM-dependent methyltransferase